jgi:hypothetical protein
MGSYTYVDGDDWRGHVGKMAVVEH